VIADRTAYDVWYSGKLSNRFLLQVITNGWYTHDPIQRVEFMDVRTQTQSTQAWLTKVHEVSE